MNPEQLGETVAEFYGTKTLVFDKAFAEKMLELNTGNRRVNGRKLARLVAQMAGGAFENTGEPLIVSAEGVLNDGQHRLLRRRSERRGGRHGCAIRHTPSSVSPKPIPVPAEPVGMS